MSTEQYEGVTRRARLVSGMAATEGETGTRLWFTCGNHVYIIRRFRPYGRKILAEVAVVVNMHWEIRLINFLMAFFVWTVKAPGLTELAFGTTIGCRPAII